MFKNWFPFRRKRRLDDLSRPDDPRGGLQDEEYRQAEPDEVVVARGKAMSGPGGAPQDGSGGPEGPPS
jgi:hypothetical protein